MAFAGALPKAAFIMGSYSYFFACFVTTNWSPFNEQIV